MTTLPPHPVYYVEFTDLPKHSQITVLRIIRELGCAPGYKPEGLPFARIQHRGVPIDLCKWETLIKETWYARKKGKCLWSKIPSRSTIEEPTLYRERIVVNLEPIGE